jgi:hypothetical protein
MHDFYDRLQEPEAETAATQRCTIAISPLLVYSRDDESNPVLPGSGAGGLLWRGRAVPVVEEGQAGTRATQGRPPYWQVTSS